MIADDDIDGEEYDPFPRLLCEGDVVLSDPLELLERTDTCAAMVRDGVLFLLKTETLKWINVEDALKTARSAAVAQFPKTKQ